MQAAAGRRPAREIAPAFPSSQPIEQNRPDAIRALDNVRTTRAPVSAMLPGVVPAAPDLCKGGALAR